jgi:hydroxylamine reductase (hybrid-cluster protein)
VALGAAAAPAHAHPPSVPPPARPQCEQTTKGTGCTSIGVCGKTPEVSALQDLLIYSLKGLGALAHHARTQGGIEDEEINSFIAA